MYMYMINIENINAKKMKIHTNFLTIFSLMLFCALSLKQNRCAKSIIQ